MRRILSVLFALLLVICAASCGCDSRNSGDKRGHGKDTLEAAMSKALGEAGLSSAGDKADTVDLKEAYRWVAKNVRYKNIEVDLTNGYTPELIDSLALHAYNYRSGSCEHVAAALYKLLERLGAQPVMVDGERYDSGKDEWGAHAWVIAKTSDGYRHFDPLFGRNHTPDPFTMFMVTDEKINETHRWDKDKYPVCG